MKTPIKNKPEPFDRSSMPVRSQTVADAYNHGDGHWEPGQLPRGGYRAVIPFNTQNENTNPTTKPQTNRLFIQRTKTP